MRSRGSTESLRRRRHRDAATGCSDGVNPVARGRLRRHGPFGPNGHLRRRAAVGRPVRRTAGALARPPAIGFTLSQPPYRPSGPTATCTAVCRPVRRTAGALARPPAIGFTLSQPPYRPSGPTATHAAARPLVVRSNGFIDGMNPVARGRLRRHGPFGPNGHARHLRRRVSSGPKDRRRACAPPSDRIYPIATTVSQPPYRPSGPSATHAAARPLVVRSEGPPARLRAPQR